MCRIIGLTPSELLECTNIFKGQMTKLTLGYSRCRMAHNVRPNYYGQSQPCMGILESRMHVPYIPYYVVFINTRTVVLVIILSLELQLRMQSVSITTIVASSRHAHGDVYLIQYYVIKLVSDLRQVSSMTATI